MKNINGIIYMVCFILGIIIVIAQLAVGGSTEALIVGLFMIGCGWFGGDIEYIKNELEAMKRIDRYKNRSIRYDA